MRWNRYWDGKEELAVKRVVGNDLRDQVSVKVASGRTASLSSATCSQPGIIVV
jgi:hypothetical protein